MIGSLFSEHKGFRGLGLGVEALGIRGVAFRGFGAQALAFRGLGPLGA